MKNIKLFILLSIAIAQTISSELPKCCPGDNYLKEDEEYCETDSGKEVKNHLDCVLFKIENYVVDKNGTMHSNESLMVEIHTDKYCVSNIKCENETEMWICYHEELFLFIEENVGEFIFEVILLILYIMSFILFLVTSLIYGFLPDLKDLQEKSTAYHCACYVIFHTNIILGTALEKYVDEYWTIYFVAYGSAYWYFAAIFWSLNIFLSVIKSANIFNWKEPDNKTLLKYKICAWGIPIILVAIIVIIEEIAPWAGVYWVLNTFLYMLTVTTIILIITIILFAISCYTLRYKINDEVSRRQIIKYKIFMYLKLFMFTFSSWAILFLISFSITRKIGVLLIASQGIIYFLMLVVLRNKVRKILAAIGYCSTEFCYVGFDEDAQDEHVEIRYENVQPTNNPI